ncbi:Carboxylesterase NlhH [Streptomyces sp. RB5]|uniref:Carboxylesterase NlhH n=1 Tax=Streptomyces smaragdinus TaxID=2585196 RepID=A0A7K0CKH8_9ACTN|nr:alpha/beta hydrolase [Streptomyces smaragdinus]MQY13986.1 Carboxylesterase NlhH [Streptomyces smaragdinus]
MALHPHLDPELRAGVEQLPILDFDITAVSYEDLPGQREQMHATIAPPPETEVVIENRLVPGAEGQPDVRLRIYRPAEPGQGRPALYWIHGGGMIIGLPEQDDAMMVGYVERLGIVGVSVDYRLAPEHQDPAQVEDCWAGLVWVAENAAELGVDPARLAVGGSSAGGGLAAAMALMARDKGGPDIAFQLLNSPMLDDRNITPSSHEFTEAVVWSRADNLYGWKALLGDRAGTGEVSVYAAPARATDLSGLPPAFVDATELEVFRDECVDYVRGLLKAGVPTEFHLYPGAFHAFDMWVPDTVLSRRSLATREAALKRAFDQMM